MNQATAHNTNSLNCSQTHWILLFFLPLNPFVNLITNIRSTQLISNSLKMQFLPFELLLLSFAFFFTLGGISNSGFSAIDKLIEVKLLPSWLMNKIVATVRCLYFFSQGACCVPSPISRSPWIRYAQERRKEQPLRTDSCGHLAQLQSAVGKQLLTETNRQNQHLSPNRC